MRVIPYSRQNIDAADIKAVEDVLRHDWITQGPAVDQFERAIADYCGARFGVAVNSGTSGLHIACLALGIGPGDYVWTSPNSFVASANAALYCGASVDFVDIDPHTLNLCPKALAARLEKAAREGRLPKALIPVHFAGEPCDMESIGALGRQYGFAVIEDAAHALGSRHGQHKIGACTYSDLVVFSFHPVKSITTGEGGMVMTQNAEIFERLCRLRSHGITRDAARMAGESEGAWYYEQLELGYNYRMTDIQAALGTSQLRRLDGFVSRRREIAGRYDAELADLPLRPQGQHPRHISAYHLYVIQLELQKLSRSRRAIFDDLRAAGINVNVHYIPIHLQHYYRKLGFKRGDFPNAENYYEGTISLPIFPAFTETDQTCVIDTLKSALVQ